MRTVAMVLATVLLVSEWAAAQLNAQSGRDRRRTPVVEVFERSRGAVVNISTTRVQPMRGTLFDEIFPQFSPQLQREVHSVGSGFFVHESGYLVTNAHVIAQASDIQVSLAGGETLPGRVIGLDQEHDLAILKVDTGRTLPFLRVSTSSDIMIGETVVAIGNPLGLQHTVTSGIVSALDRRLEFSRNTEYTGLIQTDAAINPGNSGGPLLNVNGDLIGINTAIRGDAQNVGFAIAADRLWELLPAMLDIERRERVRYGLHVSYAPPSVVYVEPGSPAAQSGFRAGDRLERFNGRPLRDAFDYYVQLLQASAGNRVQLAYRRDGSGTRTASVPLEEIPAPDGIKLARELLGVEVEEFPEDIRQRHNLSDDVGLWVRGVVRGSPADRAEIRADDLIQSIDRYPVGKIEQLGLVLERVERGERLFLEGLRLKANPPFRWRVQLRANR